MKTVEITDRTDLFALVATLEAGEDEVVIARDGRPVARLSKFIPIVRSPGVLCASPAWQDYQYDPALFAALETDDQLAAEGRFDVPGGRLCPGRVLHDNRSRTSDAQCRAHLAV